MELGKSPGEDGLTVEVYRAIFPLISEHFVQFINVARKRDTFGPSFLRALITLLRKPGTPEGHIKSYRPLSLMNVDYKIISKVLAQRLKLVMEKVVHPDQTCSVPNRTLQDNIHLARSLIRYHRQRREPFGLAQWDQEKAFDRVSHTYLDAVLERFGFKNEFRAFIRLLYKEATFRININGFMSITTRFLSGIRQGCSLSSMLYVLCLEPLLHQLRSNNRIPGLLPPGANIPSIRQRILPSGIDPTVKVSAYADDITSVVYTPEEEEETLNMFALFSKASGGKTNVSKTEILLVSDWCPSLPFKARVKSDYSIYLGVPIDVSGNIPTNETNQLITRVKEGVNMWSAMHLSFGERSTVLRSFILSPLVHIFSMVPVLNSVCNDLQTICTNFLWNSSKKNIEFNTLIGRRHEGGLALPHIESMIKSYRISCGLRALNPHLGMKWMFFAITYLGADSRWKDQLLWSNLMPHIETENELFNEVGRDTRQWLLDGHPSIINTMSQSKSVYWILVEMLFRKPVSLKWIPLECKEVFYRTLHKSKMPARVFDLWYRLSLSGLTTGSRFGRSAEQQQCMFCRDCESQAHLWVQCAYFSPLFTCLKQEVFKRYKIELARKQNDLIYMQPVITSNKTSTKNIMLMIGYYFYVIWSYRNDVKFRHMKRSGKIPLQRFKQLLLQT
ncbi:unnamed protein product [Didymodactylos carnosus]|uniref:Reverse transcriptase domain-containing protein n=1 Tax=Didymodactylos carnosus TaxID=1234261 RepID=A0A815WZ70_9BILA|nr:unnamed protein product [Didymodactylos carnosus]CAF4410637.1 unnamed protein product [Didymodactylos carnosus]